MTRLLLALASLTPGAEPDPAAALVRQLGSPSFPVREQAARELAALGRAARPALEAGSRDGDAEIRYRCSLLLPAAFDHDVKARLQAFLIDSDLDRDHGLPGWARFRDAVGNTPPNRQLYADLVRADARLLADVDRNPEAAGTALAAAALQARQNTTRGVELNEILLLVFAAQADKVKLPPPAVQTVYQLLHQPAFRDGLAADRTGPTVRKLLMGWVEHTRDESVAVMQWQSLANAYGLKELAGPAVRVALDRQALPTMRAQALAVLGQVGDSTHAAAIAPVLGDEARVGGGRFGNVTQVRDVALAITIHLHSQNPADFGFEGLRFNPGGPFSYRSMGFRDDEARADARRRWQDWLDSQKKN